MDQDLVVWYRGSAHHHPIDEDRSGAADHYQFGITRVHWFGFQLHPHNFFDANPLGEPARCGS